MTTDGFMLRLVQRHRGGAWLVACLDFDGTLAPIVSRPEDAAPPERARVVLAALAALPRLRVAVISGRALDDLVARVAVPGIAYAGSGGMQLDLFGRRVEHPDRLRFDASVAELGTRLGAVVARWPAAWLETKPAQLTLHYREVPDEARPAMHDAVRQALTPVIATIRMLDGPDAIEIAPRGGWTKGDAVRHVIGDLPPHDTLVLYAGDHGNDADGFRAAHHRGGLAIGVGAHPPPGADLRLETPAALLTWLEALADQLRPAGPDEAPEPVGG